VAIHDAVLIIVVAAIVVVVVVVAVPVVAVVVGVVGGPTEVVDTCGIRVASTVMVTVTGVESSVPSLTL
jgi:hypothetical protein